MHRKKPGVKMVSMNIYEITRVCLIESNLFKVIVWRQKQKLFLYNAPYFKVHNSCFLNNTTIKQQ